MPFMMRFQGPPRAESLNHTLIPHVNSLPSKLIDGKQDHTLSQPAPLPLTTGSTIFCVKVVENGPKRRDKLARHEKPLKSQAKHP
jgi:hypothetical protein